MFYVNIEDISCELTFGNCTVCIKKDRILSYWCRTMQDSAAYLRNYKDQDKYLRKLKQGDQMDKEKKKGIREGTQGKAANTKSHLRVHIETHYTRSFMCVCLCVCRYFSYLGL